MLSISQVWIWSALQCSLDDHVEVLIAFAIILYAKKDMILIPLCKERYDFDYFLPVKNCKLTFL